MMTCVICKTGQYHEGKTTVVIIKEETSVIIKDVPAFICNQCGEYILSEEVTDIILKMAYEAYSKGAEVEIRKFAA